MEKRTAAISVRFTEQEKDNVTKALSQYGDIAVSARMILVSFADGHAESGRMMWPPECRKALQLNRPEIEDILRELKETDAGKRLLAADPPGEPYRTKPKGKK